MQVVQIPWRLRSGGMFFWGGRGTRRKGARKRQAKGGGIRELRESIVTRLELTHVEGTSLHPCVAEADNQTLASLHRRSRPPILLHSPPQ